MLRRVFACASSCILFFVAMFMAVYLRAAITHDPPRVVLSSAAPPPSSGTAGQRLQCVAVLFKLHALDSCTRDRLDHLMRDLVTSEDRSEGGFAYHLALLFDEGVVNATEKSELHAMASRANAHQRELGGSSGGFAVCAPTGSMSVFGFSAAAMHALYPAQYPKSDFQSPQQGLEKGALLGRLRHITHDNPEVWP